MSVYLVQGRTVQPAASTRYKAEDGPDDAGSYPAIRRS